MTNTYLLLIAIFYLNFTYAQDKSWENEKILVYNDSEVNQLISANQIFEKRWDVLPQAQFWKKSCVLPLTPVSSILQKIDMYWKKNTFQNWVYLSKEEKRKFRDSIRKKYNLNDDDLVYVTTGEKSLLQV